MVERQQCLLGRAKWFLVLVFWGVPESLDKGAQKCCTRIREEMIALLRHKIAGKTIDAVNAETKEIMKKQECTSRFGEASDDPASTV